MTVFGAQRQPSRPAFWAALTSFACTMSRKSFKYRLARILYWKAADMQDKWNRLAHFALTAITLLCCAAIASSQLPPVKTDPLNPTKIIPNDALCTETEISSCAQVVAKILPLVMRHSPMEENLPRLTDE